MAVLAGVTCDYCSHRNTAEAVRCANCGAPLPVGAAVSEIPVAVPTAEPTDGGPKWLSEPVSELKTELFQHKHDSGRRYWIAAVGVVVLAAVVLFGSAIYLFFSHFGLSRPDFGDDVAAAGQLPPRLRQAATCSAYDTKAKTDRCVIQPEDPLLFGQLTGGRELTFYVGHSSREALTATIEKWRSAGGVVLRDDTVFTAIGPSADALYIDTATGLRVNTVTFPDRQDARTFLSRSGLGG